MSYDRSKSIGSSDATRIMNGDWFNLYQEKVGLSLGPSLERNFAVQLGRHTEAFHLDWIQRKIGDIQQRQRTYELAGVVPMHATIDGKTVPGLVPVEVKHCHGSTTVRDRADYYMAQLQHIMMCTGSTTIWFSAIIGNAEPEPVLIEADTVFVTRLLELYETFWWHVTKQVAPELLPSDKIEKLKASAAEVLVGGFKADQDMSTHNEWCHLATEYARLKPLARAFDETCTELKALMPEDRRKVFGRGVQILRDKAGKLQIREHKETADV